MTRIEMKVFNTMNDLLSVETDKDKIRVSLTLDNKSCVSYFSIEDMRRLARFILDEAYEEDAK